MQRTIWEWLGIERTTDKSRIKKAYAEQAKKYHPEEFPEEAQELRKAYKAAMAWASAFGNDSDRADSHSEQGILSAVSEPGHTYARPGAHNLQPESDAGAEPEYTYAGHIIRNSQPKSDAGVKPEYVYTKSMPPYMHSGKASREEPKYNFACPKMPPDRVRRIDSLKRRMEAIYATDYRNFAKDWRMAFADFLEPEDLKDTRAVREILTVIEPMRRLKSPTWEIIQTELFRYREDTAPWQLLQERFDAVRCHYEAPRKTASGTPEEKPVEEPVEEPVTTPPKKMSPVKFGLIFCSILIIIYLSTVMDKAQTSHGRREMQEELQRLIAQQIQMETPSLPVSREAFQTAFTKESPWELDLNRDEMPDHIYYDPDRGLFMVELYDSSAKAYDSYGSLNQYLEENPEAENIRILLYLVNGANNQ